MIRLNPEDLALLRASGPGVSGPGASALGAGAGTTTLDDIRAVADPSLAPGDAIGGLPDGWLDARIRSALDRAREALS